MLDIEMRNVRVCSEGPVNRGQEQFTAFGCRLNPNETVGGSNDQHRISEAEIPSGVAAGVLVTRRQEHAARPIETINEAFDGVVGEHRGGAAAHVDPASGGVLSGARGVHRVSWCRDPMTGSLTRAAPPSGRLLVQGRVFDDVRSRRPQAATTTSTPHLSAREPPYPAPHRA